MVTSFRVLAIAPIGIGEDSAAQLLQFLSRVFYLERIPTVESFRKGGTCFMQTQSMGEAKRTAQRLQMLGADFRIIHPRGHVVSEGHGRRRAQWKQLEQPATRKRRPTSDVSSPDRSQESHDTLVVSEPLEDIRPALQTVEVPGTPMAKDDLEFDHDDPSWSPFDEEPDEDVFKEDTRDLAAKLDEVREMDSIHDVEDGEDESDEDDGPFWDLNESGADTSEMQPENLRSLLENLEEYEREEYDPAPFFGADEGIDPYEFDKETSDIKPLVEPDEPEVDDFLVSSGELKEITFAVPADELQEAPDQEAQDGDPTEEDLQDEEDLPAEEDLSAEDPEEEALQAEEDLSDEDAEEDVSWDLVMLDGSAPDTKPPSSEVDFLPPSTGLDEPIVLDDFDDSPSTEASLQSVEISLDDLDFE